MLGQPKVVVVTVELRVVSGASDELIHGLQFQVTVLEEIIASYGRHIEETIRVYAVAVKEVVTCGNLYAGSHEITALDVAAQEIVSLVYLLSVGESHMHVVGFGSDIKLVFQHGKLQSGAGVVGAFTLAFHIQVGACA